MFKTIVAALVVAMGVLGTGAGWAQNYSNPHAALYFRMEWQAGQTRSGRPAISGFVYNDYNHWAGDVRLRVEALDASGQVISRTLGYVNGDVPPRGRAYFEVPLPAPAPSHRVTVEYLEWRYRGGA